MVGSTFPVSYNEHLCCSKRSSSFQMETAWLCMTLHVLGHHSPTPSCLSLPLATTGVSVSGCVNFCIWILELHVTFSSTWWLHMSVLRSIVWLMSPSCGCATSCHSIGLMMGNQCVLPFGCSERACTSIWVSAFNSLWYILRTRISIVISLMFVTFFGSNYLQNIDFLTLEKRCVMFLAVTMNINDYKLL